MASDQPKSWGNWLSLAEWWYTTTYHSSLHSTPFEILYGYPLSIHLPYFLGMSVVNQVDVQLQARKEMLQLLKHHLEQAQNRMKM